MALRSLSAKHLLCTTERNEIAAKAAAASAFKAAAAN
jgi:hypothetical protein